MYKEMNKELTWTQIINEQEKEEDSSRSVEKLCFPLRGLLSQYKLDLGFKV